MSDYTATRIDGEPGGPGNFTVPSRSWPVEPHTVIWQNAAVRWCDCFGFAVKQTCRHTEAVEALWRQESEQLLAAHRADPVSQAEARAVIERLKEVFST